MKQLLIFILSVWLPCAWGAFEVPGKGSMTLANGETQPLMFSFAYKQANSGFVFQAGQQEVEVADVPEKYTLALVLHQDKEVWVTDWVNEPIASFDWTLGQYHLVLKKNTDPKLATKARGGFVLSVNGTLYFFHKNMAQLKFHFDATGLKELSVEGMFTPGR
ncbi:hypothetical protein [Rheinheimera sp.]|uniref:hypothetical protein n=1 Tax=Rheinheimera sp. TaxID=1869214 RepID=UPI00307D27B4